MEQIDVDAIGVQAFERSLDFTQDVVARRTPVVWEGANRAEYLRRDDNIISSSLQGPAKNNLRSTRRISIVGEPVNIGAVDEIDPTVNGPPNHALGFGFVALPT
jgi:hypothetical protein